MIKKFSTSGNNISCGIEFLLRGAKKRRATAQLSAKSVNTDMGVGSVRLAAVK